MNNTKGENYGDESKDEKQADSASGRLAERIAESSQDGGGDGWSADVGADPVRRGRVLLADRGEAQGSESGELNQTLGSVIDLLLEVREMITEIRDAERTKREEKSGVCVSPIKTLSINSLKAAAGTAENVINTHRIRTKKRVEDFDSIRAVMTPDYYERMREGFGLSIPVLDEILDDCQTAFALGGKRRNRAGLKRFVESFVTNRAAAARRFAAKAVSHVGR